jgi:hypothetical protein
MERLEGSREIVMLTPKLIRDGEVVEPALYATRTMLAIEARMADTVTKWLAARAIQSALRLSRPS